MPEIDNLSIQISANETQAVDGLAKLAKTLERLKDAVNGAAPTKSEAGRLRDFGQALNALRGAENIRISSTIATQIGRIGTAIGSITTSDIQRIRDLGDALRGLNGAGNGANVDLRVGGSNATQASQAVNNGNAAPILVPNTDMGGDTRPVIDDITNASEATNVLASIIERVRNAFNSASTAASSFWTELRHVGESGRNVFNAISTIPRLLGGQFLGNIRRATSGVLGFFSSIKRIAMYRAIRSIIRAITQGFKEGTENLYHWSQAVNGHFAQSMDRIATASKYLKNSLGAMAGPLLESLAPAIDYIVDKFVDMFNYVNQLLSRLSGATTYTAAKKVASTWKDASDKSSSTAKDLKKTILAFDEINKLNGDTNGGSGTNKKSTDYSSMFETRTIENNISSFADRIKDAFTNGKWENLGKAIGEKINEAVEMVDWSGLGTKVGNLINGFFSTKYWTLDTINFREIGSNIAAFLNNAIATADFGMIGMMLVKKLTSIFDAGIGLFLNFDFGEMAKKVSQFIIGIFNELTRWINKQDWEAIGNKIWESIVDTTKNTDFTGILVAIAKFFSALQKASAKLVIGLLKGVWNTAKEWWNRNIVGRDWQDTANNLLKGIATGFGTGRILQWAWETIIDPLVGALIGEEAWSKVKDAATDIWNNIKKGWDELSPALKIGLVLSPFATAALMISTKLDWTRLKPYLPIWLTTAIDAIGGLISSIKSAWNEQNDSDKKVGVGLFLVSPAISGLILLVKKNWNALPEKLKDVGVGLTLISPAIGGLVSLIKDLWNNLPSAKKTLEVGLGLLLSAPLTLAGLIKEKWDGLDNSSKTLNVLFGFLSPVLSSLYDLLTSEWDKYMSKIGGFLGIKIKPELELDPETKSILNKLQEGKIDEAYHDYGVERVQKAISDSELASSQEGNIFNLLGQYILTPFAGTKAIAEDDNGGMMRYVQQTKTNQNVNVGIDFVAADAKNYKNSALLNYLTVVFAPGTSTDATVNLVKKWKTVAKWVGSFMGNTPVNQNVGLAKKVWSTVSSWVDGERGNTLVNQAVGLVRNMWTSVSSWTNDQKGSTPVEQGVSLKPNWTGTANSALGLDNLSSDVDIYMRYMWQTAGIDPISYMGLNNLNSTVNVDMMTPWWYWHKSPIEWMGLNNLNATVNISANIRNLANSVSSVFRRAKGGVYSNDKWSDIPQYSSGTTNAHGSLFLAGEAGPEIVGHVGGRTEVLNKSQLASAIFSAVNAAMAPAAANFAAAAQYMGGSDNTYDEDALSSMIQRAVEAAMSRSNDLDRQKVELLRQISDKDLTVEYSTSAANKAQTRMNRRAGVTIVPVGT